MTKRWKLIKRRWINTPANARSFLTGLKPTGFQPGKTPGDDGFTKEFYETFFELLWKDLIDSFNEAFQTDKLSISQRRGIISLIPKDENNLMVLSNWRPKTLLSVDYKILARAIAKRIESKLPKFVHSDREKDDISVKT